MAFKDYFSAQSSIYASHRPHYPLQLFEYFAGLCGNHEVAWDAATGNGQAALGLAKFFNLVVASDASINQISYGYQNKKIRYMVLLSERQCFKTRS